MWSLRFVNKAWQNVVDPCIDELMEGGSLLVHGGNDISVDKAIALEEKRRSVTDVVFLLNITTIGEWACFHCESLVTVVVPRALRASVTSPSTAALVF